MKDQLHTLAVEFCQKNNFQPVSLIEAAMTEAAELVVSETTKKVVAVREDLVKARERANQDNRRIV